MITFALTNIQSVGKLLETDYISSKFNALVPAPEKINYVINETEKKHHL